jgi:hypothetical protein
MPGMGQRTIAKCPKCGEAFTLPVSQKKIEANRRNAKKRWPKKKGKP